VLTETSRSSKDEKEFPVDRCNGMKIVEDEWDSNDRRLDRMYQAHHPQVTTAFEEEIKQYWGRDWKCNTEIGRLRMVMMHRPGEEIKNITPPYEKWRWLEAPNLDEMMQDHERLVRAYEDEGVEVVIRKPETNRPARLVKSIYTEDPSFPAVRGMIILRMFDTLRRGEERYTYQTYAEIGCPIVGMIHGKGMIEGGGLNWLDEKHLSVTVHYPRANTGTAEVVGANDAGAKQLERIVKEQDPEVDVKIGPGYGGAEIWLWPIDKHTSVSDPRHMDQNFVRWLKTDLEWEFLVPPNDLSFLAVSGIVLRPGKIIKPTGTPKGTKWLEGHGIEVVEVDVPSLVIPRNSGTIQCLTREIIRDPEPKG
jgi:N-dimethylarginine dimethylaminohydrolase